MLIRANGKLLLSGEYAVLDGALCLALPTRLGQRLAVGSGENGLLHWRSFQPDPQAPTGFSLWWEGVFELPGLELALTSDEEIGQRLRLLLRAVRTQNPAFLKSHEGLTVDTTLEFPRTWGLGSSSTLVYLLGKWAGVDPYLLLEHTFGGSGYDVAAAGTATPFFYQTLPERMVHPAPFAPPFLENLFLVYLGQKQDSRVGISRYREKVKDSEALVRDISRITWELSGALTLDAFDTLIERHENLLARALDLDRAKDRHFPDFPGQIKSLGAWGGDFVLATLAAPAEEAQAYFNEKGFAVFFRYRDLIIS